MAMSIGQFKVLAEPGLNNIWFHSEDEEAPKFTKFVNVRDHDGKITLRDAKHAGFGNLVQIAEGAEVTYDVAIAPVDREYTYDVFGLGYQITERYNLGDLYKESQKYEANLKARAIDDQESAAAGLFNSGFGTTISAGFDGLALFSTAHTRLDGGATQGNRPSTDEALSVAALQNAWVTMSKWVGDRGAPLNIEPQMLVVPSDLELIAYEITDSQLRPDNADNAVNVIRSRMGLSVEKWKYLTSTTAWFLKANSHDVNFNWYYRPRSSMMTDFDTDTIKRKVKQAYSRGHGNWPGYYGTTGT